MSRRSGPLSDIDRAKDTFLCCSRCSHCEAREKHHKTCSFRKHKTTRRWKEKSPANKVISGQLFLFPPLDRLFFSFRLCHYETNSIWEKAWKRKILLWQVYSPRRASRPLSDQLLKTRFSSEQLPFAPVLKLKFTEKATVKKRQCGRRT